MKSFQGSDKGSQKRAITFLSDPQNYSPTPLNVELIETHGAYIFLAGKVAYKMKRAVSFSYMDFSSLEKRYAACKREIDLNLPHAPDIYRGLKTITEEKDGSLVFDGQGKPIEWVVYMSRFKERDLLSNVATAGPFPKELSKAIAEVAFRYHQQAPRWKDVKSLQQITSIARDVLKTLQNMIPYLNKDSVSNLETFVTSHTKRLSTLLIRREEEGCVRRCHGDMHLSNIVLIGGKPVLFDALEFSEEMATTDVLYDLAFLLMDLDHRGQREAANIILNRYLWLSSKLIDINGLQLLPLFLSLRASIRGMVRAQRALQTSGEKQSELFQASQAYINRANSYFQQTEIYLILIGGLSGSGKSTLSERLAPDFGRCPGAVHLRSDLERKRLYSVSDLDPLPQEYYTKEINDRVYSVLFAKADAALHAGHSVIVDAVFAKADERNRLEFLAKQQKALLFTFWLEAPTPVLISRVTERILDASDATKEVIMKQVQYDLGDLRWERIDARGTPDQIVSKVKEKMKVL